ncbi:Wzz/FepE/Etk N-terminal domain-containing protein [Lactobacillus sp. ESL0791]|uniref:YveK family protein n=1 Tax=Lactobacillus sp. ESL0791 TaxID=2983234 RepID=UPI0023F741D6|nr:Wzz/FepE/Etk N-terminal domain-containing protein [Lactobacillus sp. ESL0791]MDF7639829.1 Wzz/FepE/Etk N-terminal domain-containing protein [Lactobacillus sp. ESL0791]
MENYFDFYQILEIIRKHIIFIIASFVICIVAAMAVEKFVITPQYTATTQILVNQKKVGADLNGVYQGQQADVQMINTYKDIITNQVVLKAASQNLANPNATTKPYDISVKQLQKAISITNNQNSQVFALNIKSHDPDEAAAIANEIASVFKRKIGKIMSINNVTIVSKALPIKQKTFPKTSIMLLIGATAGLVIGLGYAFIREMTDTTIKDTKFLTTELGLTDLGHIFRIQQTQDSNFTNSGYYKRTNMRRHRRV